MDGTPNNVWPHLSLLSHSNFLYEPPWRHTFYFWSRKTQERKMSGLQKYGVIYFLSYLIWRMLHKCQQLRLKELLLRSAYSFLISSITVTFLARKCSQWDGKQTWVHLEGRQKCHMHEGQTLSSIQISPPRHFFKCIHLQANLASFLLTMQPKR